MTPALFFAVALIGYMLGSIPCGVIISRKFANKDLLQAGSGKTGTTNVLRTAGKKAAALALILDIGKGALAVTLAGLIFKDRTQTVAVIFTLNESAKVLAGLAAIAGHTWSIFLRFKGGRGVATFMGTLLALYWPAGALGGICVLGLGIRTKYMSLGSIIGAVTAFIMLMAFNVLKIELFRPYPPFEYVVFAMIGAVFIYIMHRDNIMRLFNGTERKIGEKTKAETLPSSNNPK